jgi:hypothetical protein
MPLVSWSPQAELGLQRVVADPDVRDLLRQDVGQILHDVEENTMDHGAADGVMWHRGTTHDQARQLEWSTEEADDGPWNYFLLYRLLANKPGYEVITVISIRQIAILWEQASRDKQPALTGLP